MSPVDWSDDDDLSGGGKYIYLPKVGESQVYKIKEVRKVTKGADKFHIIRREKDELEDGTEVTVEKNLGFHLECDLDNGKILSITSLSPFIAFKQAKVNDDDEVEVNHPKKGSWEIKVTNRDEPAPAKDESAEGFVIEFGPHKDKKMGQVYEEKPDYIEMLASKVFNPSNSQEAKAKECAVRIIKLFGDGNGK